MKLDQILQEGVFSGQKKQRGPNDYTPGKVRALSDNEIDDLIDKFGGRYRHFNKMAEQTEDKIVKIPSNHPKDAQYIGYKDSRTQYWTYHSEFRIEIRPDSEAEQEMETLMSEFTPYNNRAMAYQEAIQTMWVSKKKRDAIKRKVSRDEASGSWPEYQKQNPRNKPPTNPSKLPKSASVKPSLSNPYFKGTERKYIGHPAHYPHWSGEWKRRILAMEEILNRNGKGPLTMMYAGTFNNAGKRFNFMIYGANGNLLWRKYDSGPASGQNWLMINGLTIQTSRMEKANPDQQDLLMGPA